MFDKMFGSVKEGLVEASKVLAPSMEKGLESLGSNISAGLANGLTGAAGGVKDNLKDGLQLGLAHAGAAIGDGLKGGVESRDIGTNLGRTLGNRIIAGGVLVVIVWHGMDYLKQRATNKNKEKKDE
eukprot:TRINITY_DN78592_c0_g1_i1.p1 TRINITY_DN78592_c0_g1~~TRINITY_DN78592_c0_g1_i1.p1  ORF type:complete len:126 (+),score=22.71 TRINITY_DN78592_c0_g1_i1:39-416(+)